MDVTIASLHLSSITPYSQSRGHSEPKLKGELHDAYEFRTWKSHLTIDANGLVAIPAHGFHQSLSSAARYSKKQIPTQGKATWTAKFESGIVLLQDISTDVHADDVEYIDIFANSDGKRGSGKRVIRRYPIINEWTAKFDIYVLDPIITREVFAEMIAISGMFIGLGRFRAEKGGTNGRFRLDQLEWQEKHALEALAA